MPMPTDIIELNFMDGTKEYIETINPDPGIVNNGLDYHWRGVAGGSSTYPREKIKFYRLLSQDQRITYRTNARPGSFVMGKPLYKGEDKLLIPVGVKSTYLNGGQELVIRHDEELLVQVISGIFLVDESGNKAEWNYVVGKLEGYDVHYGYPRVSLDDQDLSSTQIFRVKESLLTTLPAYHLPIYSATFYTAEIYNPYSADGEIGEAIKYDVERSKTFRVVDKKFISDYPESEPEWWYVIQFYDPLAQKFEDQNYITRSTQIRM
jgi:hypothetical protein